MNNYDLVFANIYCLKVTLKCSISDYTCVDFFLLTMQLFVMFFLVFGESFLLMSYVYLGSQTF